MLLVAQKGLGALTVLWCAFVLLDSNNHIDNILLSHLAPHSYPTTMASGDHNRLVNGRPLSNRLAPTTPTTSTSGASKRTPPAYSPARLPPTPISLAPEGEKDVYAEYIGNLPPPSSAALPTPSVRFQENRHAHNQGASDDDTDDDDFHSAMPAPSARRSTRTRSTARRRRARTVVPIPLPLLRSQILSYVCRDALVALQTEHGGLPIPVKSKHLQLCLDTCSEVEECPNETATARAFLDQVYAVTQCG